MTVDADVWGSDRGLAVGMLVFVILIGVAALLYTLFDPAVSQTISTANNSTTNTAAQDHINLLETIWSNILFFALFLGGVGLIARSVFEGRRV